MEMAMGGSLGPGHRLGVDREVARDLGSLDIGLVLERNWPTLGRSWRRSSLTVITGDLDACCLEGAMEVLEEMAGNLGSDAVVEIVRNRDQRSRGPRSRAGRAP